MSAPALEVDEQLSWARRAGDEVSILLRLPGAGLEAGTAAVELASESRRLRATAEVTTADGAVEVALRVPRRELGSSAWRLTIETQAGARFVPVEARLLAAPTSPVALLPGPAPLTRMRPPTPRSRRSLALRLADRLPGPLRSVLRRTRSRGRAVVGRLR